MSNKFDYLVIGAGPGGTDAALTIRRYGFTVALIEKDKWGGTCLHQGCIPTKALLHLTKPSFGGELVDLFTQVFAKVNAIASNLIANLTKEGITLIHGEAIIIDGHHVKVAESVIETDHIIYAVGSRPIKMKITGIDNPHIYDSETIYRLKERPRQVAIIGGGYIGFEWAIIFTNLGAEVTIYEAQPQVLLGFDDDVRRRLLTSLRQRKITIRTSVTIESFTEINNGIMINSVTSSEHYDIAMLAIGRRHEAVVLPEGIIKIGDANGTPYLAHKASAEGKRLFDQDHAPFIIPSVMFTDPEVAVTGYSEKQLIDLNIEYHTVKLPYRANSKAFVIDKDDGFVKLIVSFDKTLILGVAIIGHDASNIINVLTLAIEEKIPVSKLKRLVFPHPTIGEVISQALDLITEH